MASGSAQLPLELVPAMDCTEVEAILVEIESLCQPCELEFECWLLTGRPVGVTVDYHGSGTQNEDGHSPAKRTKLDDEATHTSTSGSRTATNIKPSHKSGSKLKGRTKSRKGKGVKDAESMAREEGLFLEFEWLSGDNRDMLHQIVQYLRNKIQDLKF